MIIHLRLTLEDAVEDVADLCTHGVTNHTLHAIAAEITVGSYSLRQFGNLIPIGSDIGGDIVAKVAHLAAVAQVKLHTFVLHLTGIDPHG